MPEQRRSPARGRATIGCTLAALRSSREALVGLEGQLGDLLTSLRSPAGAIDRSAADRLGSAKEKAVRAMAELQSVGHLFG